MKTNTPLYISYYTKNTVYELEVQNLIKSLEKYNLPYHIEAIDDLGSWQKNTQYKAQFIFECLREFDRPIVWIDADAVIEQQPLLFNELVNDEVDVAVHYRYITDDCQRLLSGTIFMRPSGTAFLLITKWIGLNHINSKALEQFNLGIAIQGGKDVIGLKVEELPATYCNIFDLMDVDDPVITHYQASRKVKK